MRCTGVINYIPTLERKQQQVLTTDYTCMHEQYQTQKCRIFCSVSDDNNVGERDIIIHTAGTLNIILHICVIYCVDIVVGIAVQTMQLIVMSGFLYVLEQFDSL